MSRKLKKTYLAPAFRIFPLFTFNLLEFYSTDNLV